jgi:hypothetical protein
LQTKFLQIAQIKNRIARLESETQDVISQILERQSRIEAVGKSLADIEKRMISVIDECHNILATKGRVK